MELQLSRLEKEMENIKEKFKKEFDALKYDIHSIKEEILNEIRALHTCNSSTKEVKKNKDVESQSLTVKVEAQLKIKKFESMTCDFSSAQDPYFHGSTQHQGTILIPKMDTSKFDGNYHVT